MILRSLASILLAASALTSAGCPVAFNDTDSVTDSLSSTTGEASTGTTGSAQTSSGTTADETGTPTTGPTSTGMTEAGTTGTTAEGTTAEGTTAESTTTGGVSDLPASCEAACETLLGCDPDAYPDQAICVAECIDAAPNDDLECEGAAAVFNTCVSGFDCKQLMAAMEDNEFGACTDAFQDYIQLCM